MIKFFNQNIFVNGANKWWKRIRILRVILLILLFYFLKCKSRFAKHKDMPLHTTTLTFLMMAWDRFRYVRNPTKPRLPAFVCTIGTWLTSMCLVLPYPIYIIYLDLAQYVPEYEGLGLCTVNLADDMQEYMRGIFLIMYVGPLATISYLYVRVSREVQKHQSSLAVILYETRGREGRSRTDSHSTATDFRSSRGDCDRSSQISRNSYRDHENGRVRYEGYDPDIDVIREKRTQKYLVPMVTMYAICLCPLMILRLARPALLETYDNSGHFDITYTMFVWVGFIPVCSTPALYAMWQMSSPSLLLTPGPVIILVVVCKKFFLRFMHPRRGSKHVSKNTLKGLRELIGKFTKSSKERLRGYFRFSNRKLRQSCETVITAAGTPAVPRAKCSHVDSIIHHVDEGQSDNNSFQQDLTPS